MTNLPNVTLCIIDCVNYGPAIQAIRKSLSQITPAKTIFLTDISAVNPNFPFEIIKIPKIDSKEAYSTFVIKELHKYISTDYVLIIQHDAWVLDGSVWDDGFLEYDYIGAPWLYIDGRNVGNGGFSLRSKRLHDILASDEFILPVHPEDDAICRTYRHYLERKYNIKFAPEDIADKFSFELREPSQKTFGFHGKFHKQFKPTVVVKRTGALGDLVAVEPLLKYYFDKGYNVVIDAPLHLAMIYSQHYFPVRHISQLTDGRVPYTLIDLDGAYETNPKQLHLKSYYDRAGITDGEIRSPKLNMVADEFNRLFVGKYAVIHNDVRDQPSRNIYGVDWGKVVERLHDEGFIVIQAGMSPHLPIEGAIDMRTVTVNMLVYLMAGASLFVGIDSGISNIAAAFHVPSVICVGSVNPEYIYPDMSNIEIVNNHPCCEKKYCWNEVVSTTGQDCYIDKNNPPCTNFETDKVINAINQFFE